jgi:hypothetical protein
MMENDDARNGDFVMVLLRFKQPCIGPAINSWPVAQSAVVVSTTKQLAASKMQQRDSNIGLRGSHRR